MYQNTIDNNTNLGLMGFIKYFFSKRFIDTKLYH